MNCIKNLSVFLALCVFISGCAKSEDTEIAINGRYTIEIKTDVLLFRDTITIGHFDKHGNATVSRKAKALLVKAGKFQRGRTLSQSWITKLGKDGKTLVSSKGYPTIFLKGVDETIRISGNDYLKIK